MKIENVKGIVWDLDGTLIDSFGIFEQVITDVVSESGHTMPTREFMLNHYHGSLEESVKNVLGVETAEEVDTLVSTFLEKQQHHYADDLETHLFMDAAMLAQHAATKGIHQLLVTNRAHKGRGNASPRAIIAATFLADCIHEIHPRDEVEQGKPDKGSVGDWMERNQLTPDKVLVIGDQFVDAQLAINLGSRAILVMRNGDIPHLDDLKDSNSIEIIQVDSLENIELN